MIRRQPEAAPKDKPPDVPVTFTAKDLLAYPLFIDLWNDVFAQKLTDKRSRSSSSRAPKARRSGT